MNSMPVTPDGLDMLIREYLDYRKQGLNPIADNTVRIYRTDLDSFRWWWVSQEIPLEELTPMALRGYKQWLVLEQAHAPLSVNRKLTILRGFFAWLVWQKVALVNPVLEASRVNMREPEILPRFISPDEVERVLASVSRVDTTVGRAVALRDLAMLEVLYGTGVRLAELVGMDLEGIRFEDRIIRVLGKGRKEREVIFGQEAEKALSLYLSQSRPRLLGKTARKRNQAQKPALWLNRYGGRISRRSVELIVNKHGKAAGLKVLRPHMLRHGFATAMLNNGAALSAIQELLGHASVVTTQVYTHISQVEERKALLAFHPLAKGE